MIRGHHVRGPSKLLEMKSITLSTEKCRRGTSQHARLRNRGRSPKEIPKTSSMSPLLPESPTADVFGFFSAASGGVAVDEQHAEEVWTAQKSFGVGLAGDRSSHPPLHIM